VSSGQASHTIQADTVRLHLRFRFQFLSRVSTVMLTRDIDTGILSVRQSRSGLVSKREHIDVVVISSPHGSPVILSFMTIKR